MPDGLYQIRATCVVKQAGRRVPVDLVWLDDKKDGVDQASAGGIVRDFRLVTSGLKPGADPKATNAYFGGELVVNGPTFDVTRGHLSTRFPDTIVQLTLTPQGAMVDGSKRAPFTIDMDVTETNYGSHRRGIPIGVYRVSARLVAKDGGTRALNCSRDFNGEYGESAEIYRESLKDDAETLGGAAVYLKD